MSMRVIGGQLKGRKLPSTGEAHLRPTSSRVKGAIFSILGEEAIHDARVLDLYAGTGALGIEALSRGALWVDFVEVSSKLCAQLRNVAKELAFEERCHVHCAKVESALGSLKDKYDLVFLDPPYGEAAVDEVMASLSRADMVLPNGTVLVEHSRFSTPQEQYGMLQKEDARRYGDTCLSIYRLSGGRDG